MDLKNLLNVETLEKQFNALVETGKKNLEQYVEDTKTRMREASRAAADMAASKMADIIERASAVFVKEVEVPALDRGTLRGMQVRASISNYSLLEIWDPDKALPPGRYRAVVLFIPLSRAL